MLQKKIVEKIKTHFIINNFFANPLVCEVKRNNIVEPDMPQMKTWRTCIARWISKATNTHSDCVIFIAFPRASMLRS